MKAAMVNDGKISVVEWQNLKDLQAFVGGFVEALEFKDGADALINEEGKIKGLPYNPLATALCQMFEIGLADWDFINGPMLITGPVTDGDWPDVTEKMIADLHKAAAVVPS